MTQKQHPIGSGFTAASTADEVLQGIDLSGTNVVVTGGHVGLGLQTTRALSKAGASDTVGSRNPDRAPPRWTASSASRSPSSTSSTRPRSMPSPRGTSTPAARSTS